MSESTRTLSARNVRLLIELISLRTRLCLLTVRLHWPLWAKPQDATKRGKARSSWEYPDDYSER